MTDSKDIQQNTARQTQSSAKHSQTVIAQFSSPLPPPEMLANYERAQPGLINKIIEMTEKESNHRRELEKQKLLAEVESLHRGDTLISRAQIFALIIAVLTIVGGCTTAILGAPIAGGIIGITGIAGIIGSFIKNSKRG
jgi:uncharacterized membrane protein